MINLPISDKYELLALHQALMEAKFHPNPIRGEIQSSPKVASLMNAVLERLEVENWVTEAEKRFRGVTHKNDWAEWRQNPGQGLVVDLIERHLGHIDEIEHDEVQFHEFICTLLAPYTVSREEALQFVAMARQSEI